MGHELVFVGANPAALLWDGDQATAFVSVWQVDWSQEGSGGAIVLCRPGELRVLCDPPLLGRWLFDTFVSHFSELKHLERPARPTVERTPVKIDLDLTAGLRASWGGPQLDIVARTEIIEAPARADGSAGWSAMLGSDGGFYSSSLDDEAGRSLYPDLDAVTAGGVLPAGRLDRGPDGYRLSG